ncbi:MAG TPA: hypothetical protein VKO38_01505 [Wenzhouxiangella sp.]|nr:hypothetical protein [Wenzhouxiangella sp.]
MQGDRPSDGLAFSENRIGESDCPIVDSGDQPAVFAVWRENHPALEGRGTDDAGEALAVWQEGSQYLVRIV